MKNSIFIVLFLLLLLFSFNCKKETEERNVNKGRVVDLVTNEPVPNAYVALFKSGGDILMPSYTQNAETFTDANGYFDFGINSDGTEIQAAKANYYDSRMYTTIGDDYLNNSVVTLEPFAYLNLHCKNVNKVYSSILFYLLIKGSSVRFVNADVDTSIYGVQIHSANTKLEYVLGRYQGSERIDSLTYVPISPKRFDTIDVYVNY